MIIRPLKQSDKKEWIKMFQNLSMETVENRYHHSIKNTDIDTAKRYWTNLIHNSLSTIVEINNKIVGCGELYIMNNINSAEIAITITDKWQNVGIGVLLMNYMETFLRINYQILSIMLNILPTNIRMKKLAINHNFIKDKDNIWIKEM